MNYYIGVLSLQGGYKEIINILSNYDNIYPIEIYNKEDLKNINALIIPGGESTTIIKCIIESDMEKELEEFIKNKPVWGICAGLIILTEYFKCIDIKIKRNFFGRQKQSFIGDTIINENYKKFNLVSKLNFIRAPAITDTKKNCEIISYNIDESFGSIFTAVKNKNIFLTCFHPEISINGYTWFSYFIKEICQQNVSQNSDQNILYPPYCASNTLETIKKSFPIFQQRGVIMDVVTKEQAEIAEKAGAVSVMALEKIPADIKNDGGIARSSDPKLIKEIMNSVSIPVMAKVRIGHFAEAQILEEINVDCIDESEVLTCADEIYHINKNKFKIPFVCGAKDLGEALRRISEGASMIRLKGNAGTGNVMHAVKHARTVFSEIRMLKNLHEDEIYVFAKEKQVSVELVKKVKEIERLPVVTFAAGGIATPADVSLLMQLGCDGVFVGSGIFKGDKPYERAKAMVKACSHYHNTKIIAKVSENLGKPMVGILEKGESYSLINKDDKI